MHSTSLLPTSQDSSFRKNNPPVTTVDMKLIIAGSTGFVGAELVRQSLGNPAITSIIALSRRENPGPPEAGPAAAKLTSIVCDNFESYPDSVKKELGNADACIWYGFPLCLNSKRLTTSVFPVLSLSWFLDLQPPLACLAMEG